MSDEPVFAVPEPRSPLPAAAIGAAVHAGLWLLLFAGLGSVLVEQRRLFDELHVQLPHSTRWALNFGRLLYAEPILAVMGLVGLVAMDGFVLYRLGRHRVLRELWSGIMVALPVAAFALVAGAVGMAHNKLTQALTRPNVAMSQAEKAVQEKTAGTWKLVALEKDGAAAEVPAVTLTVDGQKFTWDAGAEKQGGAIYVNVGRNPLGVTMWFADAGANQASGLTRHGLLKVTADRLVLCLGQPETYGEALPDGFTTKGTTNELFTFEKGP
jgi:uncharacterized protein (TIGR03067 family)